MFDYSNNSSCFCSDIMKQDYSSAYAWFNFFVIIVLLAAISLFGVISNTINIFLYCQPQLQDSGNTYLIALACSDFMVIITGFAVFWIDSMRTYNHSLKYAPYMSVYVLPLGYIAQTCSIYFTVAAATNCYLMVCWAGCFRKLHTVSGARQVVILIFLLSVLYNTPRFGQFFLRLCHPEINSLVTAVEICPTKFFFVVNTVYNVYMYMAVLTFIPFIVLCVLNVLIIVYLYFEKSAGESGPDEDPMTLIMVVVMFLACNTLALVVNIVETFVDISDLVLNYLTDASNLLILFNSSVNFIIYLAYSKPFFEAFKLKILCRRAASSLIHRNSGQNHNQQERVRIVERPLAVAEQNSVALPSRNNNAKLKYQLRYQRNGELCIQCCQGSSTLIIDGVNESNCHQV